MREFFEKKLEYEAWLNQSEDPPRRLRADRITSLQTDIRIDVGEVTTYALGETMPNGFLRAAHDALHELAVAIGCPFDIRGVFQTGVFAVGPLLSIGRQLDAEFTDLQMQIFEPTSERGEEYSGHVSLSAHGHGPYRESMSFQAGLFDFSVSASVDKMSRWKHICESAARELNVPFAVVRG